MRDGSRLGVERALDGGEQIACVEWLRYDGMIYRLVNVIAGDENHGWPGMPSGQVGRQLEPVQPRHLQVRDHQLDAWAGRLQHGERLQAILGGEDPVALPLQNSSAEVTHGSLILDHEYGRWSGLLGWGGQRPVLRAGDGNRMDGRYKEDTARSRPP